MLLSMVGGYLSGWRTLKPMHFKMRGMPWFGVMIALLKQTKIRLKFKTSSQYSNKSVKFSRDNWDGMASSGKKIARVFFSGIFEIHCSHTDFTRPDSASESLDSPWRASGAPRGLCTSVITVITTWRNTIRIWNHRHFVVVERREQIGRASCRERVSR